MSEAQIGYVMDCLRLMRKRGSKVMEVKAGNAAALCGRAEKAAGRNGVGSQAAAAVGIRTPGPVKAR